MNHPSTIWNSVKQSTRLPMRRFARCTAIGLGLLVLPVFVVSAVAADKSPQKLPKFEKIERVVHRTLAKEDINPGELLSQGNVAEVLAQLKKRGWKVRDEKQIVSSALPDDAYLVKRLARPDAHKFKQQVAQLPGGYDRLDRMSRMSQGRSTVDALVRGPDGYKMIEYMTTSRGGRNLGNSLAQTPRGKDFNKPTGRIYTTSQLVARLKLSYREALKSTRESTN